MNEFFIFVPWSDVAALGSFFLLRALTHVVTDTTKQRTASIATKPAMQTGIQFIFSTRYKKHVSLLRIKIGFERKSTANCLLSMDIFIPCFFPLTTSKVLSVLFFSYSFDFVILLISITSLLTMHSWSLNSFPLVSKTWPSGQLRNTNKTYEKIERTEDYSSKYGTGGITKLKPDKLNNTLLSIFCTYCGFCHWSFLPDISDRNLQAFGHTVLKRTFIQFITILHLGEGQKWGLIKKITECCRFFSCFAFSNAVRASLVSTPISSFASAYCVAHDIARFNCKLWTCWKTHSY